MELRKNNRALSLLRRVGIALVFAALLLGSAAPATAAPASGETRVDVGCYLADKSWWSPNERVHFAWQGDGNLVVYYKGVAKWASWTNGRGYTLCFQGEDGNLVIYDRNDTPIWDTQTDHEPNFAQLVVQNDGNVVMYRNHIRASNWALWQTGTRA